MTNQELVARMAYEHTAEIYRCCLAMLRDRQLAEDASQETFLRALRKISGFRRQSGERTWLLAIAMNVCRDMLRKPYHQRVMQMAEVRRIDTAEPYSRLEARDAMLEAIAALPEKQRAAVLLHYYYDLSVPEVAQALRISRGTASAHLTRARRALREMLDQEGGERSEPQCL